MKRELLNGGKDADEAFAVHGALIRAEINQPSLADNKRWRRLREIALAEFNDAFEASE